MYKSILDTIKNYVLMDSLGQAILIDGEWGGGKTYFIKNVLMKDEIVNKKDIFYISLYGKSKLSDIDSAIFAQLVEKKTEKTNNTLASIVKWANKFRGYFKFGPVNVSGVSLDVDTNQIIQELFLDCSKILFIFDDFERCSINYKDLLGYINNIVEHKSGLVLIIANERILKNNGTKKTEKNYLDAKEKVIHSTIKFETNIEGALSSLISHEIDSDFKEILEIKKNLILNRFNMCHCENIRILCFSIYIFKNIYSHLICKLEELKESERNYLLDELLDYTVFSSINFKKSNSIASWEKNETWKTVNVDSNYYNTIYAFRFIDEYISKLILSDVDFIWNSLSEVIKVNENKDLSIHRLREWERLESSDLIVLLDQLRVELLNNKYPLPLYKNILVFVVEAYKYSLLSEDNESKLSDLLDQICKNFHSWPCVINLDLTCYNEDLKILYEEKIKCIREAVQTRNKKLDDNLLLEPYIKINEETLLMEIVIKYKSEYLMQKSFFRYLGSLDNLIEYCKMCKNIKLVDLRSVLYEMYYRNGLSYKNDIKSLEEFKYRLESLINTSDNIDSIKLQNLKFINEDINGYIKALKDEEPEILLK